MISYQYLQVPCSQLSRSKDISLKIINKPDQEGISLFLHFHHHNFYRLINKKQTIMKRTGSLLAAAAAIGLAVIFSACSKIDDVVEKSAQNPLSGVSCDFTAILSDEEIDGLLHMYEEEKMARDVYLKFYELYQTPVFRNIASSEQKHVDAMLFLINGYEVTNDGRYADKFKALYDGFIALGTTITAAYEVGVEIEETDIADLTAYVAATTIPNLVQVYTNLLAASQTHLSTFTSKL
jgi:hypothetical protein